MDLSTTLGSLVLKNPLIVASCDASLEGRNFHRLVDYGAGAIVTKSITDIPQLQSSSITRFKILDPDSRYFTMLSRGGPMLPLEKWLNLIPDWLGYAHQQGTRIIGNLCCSSLQNWVDYALIVERAGVDMIELNLGNPHTGASDKPAGYLLGQSIEASSEVVRAVAGVVKVPLMVKLTPQVEDLTPVVKAMFSCGASAVNVMHRYQGFRVDINTGEAVLGGWAGVGGPWMKPISLAWIAKSFNQKAGPVCGGNGVSSWEDVVEYIMAGASAVQFATVLYARGLDIIHSLLNGLESFLVQKNYSSVRQIIGVAARSAVGYKELDKIKNLKYVNNPEVCSSCGLNYRCMEHCFFQAIQKEGTRVRFNEKCTGCGLCLDVCHVPGAISIAQD